MADQFEVGDKVRLKSGGPVMTVNSLRTRRDSDQPQEYLCKWFAGKKLHSGYFADHSLEVVADDDPEDA